jgi:hypothetical protein
MKAYLLITSVLIGLVSLIIANHEISAAESGGEYRILVAGMHHGGDVGPFDSNDWYGLFPTDSGYSLETVELRSDPCHDYCVDGAGESTAVCISVDQTPKPLVLVQSRRSLRTGLVRTAYAERTDLVPGVPVHLGQHNRKVFSIVALGEVTDEGHRPPGDLLILGYTLKLYRQGPNGGSQVLAEFERLAYDGLPNIRWAGDLDGDGLVDLLLDIRNRYGTRHYALYLSSEANAEQLVELVADLRMSGC